MLHESHEGLSLKGRSKVLIGIEATFFILITTSAFFGNLFVCYTVYKNQRLRTLCNMFIVALAVSDILMSSCCMPFSVGTLIRGEWIFGVRFCRFHGFAVFTCGLASLHTMGIIAISRYFCVVRPDKYATMFKKQRILIYILLVWCAALIGSTPPFFFANGGFEFQPGKAMCLYTFQANIGYTIFIETIYIGTPLTFIVVCYAKVFFTVSKSNRVFSQDINPRRRLRANVEEAKVTKTLAIVMLGFAICWLPVCIIDYIDAARGKPTLPRQVYLTYGFLVYLSSTINPVIYAATNKYFRREYKNIFGKCFCLGLTQCLAQSEDSSAASDARKPGTTQAK